MNARQMFTLIFGGVLAYGVLLACLLTFWLTTTAVFGGPLP